MVAPTAEILKRPNRKGFMSPLALLEVARAVEEMLGADARDEALREAQVFRMPERNEPVREEKAARLHAAVRRLWPDDWEAIGHRAGQGAARFVLDHRLPGRGRQLLTRLPRPAAAWLLARRTEQQAWTFAGSARFVVETAARFAIYENPLARGARSNRAICHYQSGFFEGQFRAVVHSGLRCVETACIARGDEACLFHLTVPEEAAGP